jgi:REP element-mobilizing transposase RayT
MSRGADGRKIFHTISDRNRFLSLLESACVKYDALIYTYVLMNSHYHLLLETRNSNLSRLMHHINASYALYFNWKHDKSGHVLQSRYKAIVVEKEPYLLEISRYIHLNPVRAKICAKPEDYRWSSYAYYADCNEPPSWLHTDWVIDRFGRTRKTALQRYVRFTVDGIHSKISDPLKNTFAGVALGSEDFVNEIREIARELKHREIPSARQIERSWDIESIVNFVSGYFGVHPRELKEPRTRIIGRKLAICLIRQYTPAPIQEIATYFGISYTAIPRIVSLTRQDRSLASEIRNLEQLLVKVKT